MKRPTTAIVALLAAQAMAASTAPGEFPDPTSCEAGLARTLAVMEARPLMKEEEATGLMWLRLDAHRALDEGDVRTCLEKLAAVESILGVSRDTPSNR